MSTRDNSNSLETENEMKDYHINIFYSDEDGGYIADLPDLPGCSAFGATPEAALKEVGKARKAWVETSTRRLKCP